VVGRYDDRVQLWRHLDPGARVWLTGPGARALTGWAVRALRETTGHRIVEVEGHTGDPPGAALLRMVDEMVGVSGAKDPVRAGLEALGRLRIPTADEGVDPVSYAVHTLLGGRSQTTPIRHGALVALLDALTRQRGAAVLATDVVADPDLAALVPRLARAIPDLVLVCTGSTASAPDGWTELHIAGPSHAEAVDAIVTHTGLTPREATAQLARHDDIDHALDATPLAPLAGLTPSERLAIERAAVLGPVDREVWARMVDLNAGQRIGLEDELVRRGIARRRSGGWVFRDEAFRESLVQRLVARDEAEDTWAAAASALEALDDDPLRRGRIWLSAGRAEQALRTWLRQADRIEDEHGRRRSVELWGTARVVAHELPLAPDVHGEIDTRYLCGMVMLLDRREEAARLAEVTRLTFEQRGWNRAAALCCWVQAVAAGVSEPEVALRAVEDGLSLVEGREEAQDVAGRLWGMRFRLSHERGTGEHMSDMEHARDALSTQTDARSRLLFHRMAGLLAQARDDRTSALLHFSAQVEIARHSRPRALPESIVQYAAVLAAEGRTEEAEPLLEEALELAEFAESAHQAAYAAINLMTLALKRDAFGRAATLASRVLDYAAYSPHAALACDIGLALVAVALDDPAAENAWVRARSGLTAPHSPEADFVDMLDRIATLAADSSPSITREAQELAERERAALEDQQRA
jgi:tetratricopeptide (TPR) repeat protein